jgi:hypothetical protein
MLRAHPAWFPVGWSPGPFHHQPSRGNKDQRHPQKPHEVDGVTKTKYIECRWQTLHTGEKKF